MAFDALLSRRAVIAAKVELAEGTAETLTVSEAAVLVYDPKFDTNIDRFDRNPARATLSKLASVIGKQAAQLTFKTEVKGSGTIGTAPAWAPMLRGAGFKESRVMSVAIGAITSGPFQGGETITQATSGATGRVVGDVATGASVVPYVPLTGTMLPGLGITGGTSGATATTGATGARLRMSIGAVAGGPFTNGETVTGGTSAATAKVVGATANGATHIILTMITGTMVTSEVLTGGSSGATATTSSSPEGEQGFEYLPLSRTQPPSLTMALYEDGVRKLLYGARGNVKMTALVGQPAFWEFTFMGVYDATTDVAVLEPTYESTVPYPFMGVGFTAHSLAMVFSKWDLDMANTMAPRLSANATKGILAVQISDRNPKATLDPEMTLVADHDWMGRLVANTMGRCSWSLGTTQANKIVFVGPLTQYEEVKNNNRDGIATADLTLGFKSATVSTGDDEVQIGLL